MPWPAAYPVGYPSFNAILPGAKRRRYRGRATDVANLTLNTSE